MPNPLRRARRLREPQQARSRSTRERLIRAAEELLTKHDFPGMTVRRIAKQAHASEGTFYKHFPRKRDLLPVLVDREQSALSVGELDSIFQKLAGASLTERIGWIVDFVAATTTRRRNILRACITARYATDLALSSIQIARTRDQLQRVHDWLLQCRAEFAHDDPPRAVRVGVYLTLQSLQTALLFEQLPADLPPSRLILEARRMLLSYLTGGRTSA
jgi:AcrR family transcriptional regulator